MARTDAHLAESEERGAGDPAWPDVCVVLLVDNPGDREVETAAIVRSQRYGGEIAILVIDSSFDPTTTWSRAIRTAADEWEALPPKSFGHARTRNHAVDLSTKPVVAFLSSDAHPASDRWLERLVRPLAEGRAQASYGRQVPPQPDAEREATYEYLYPETPVLKSKARIRELGIRAFTFSDVTSAFLTDVARRVRFPDDLGIFEDVGIAKRLLDDGCHIAYVPDAVVFHVHELGIRELVRRYRRIGAVYEHMGIFAELRKFGRMALLREGARTTWAVTPHERNGPRSTVQSLLLGGLKLTAVTYGRMQVRWKVAGAVR